jgi:hypothetical protein
LHKGVEVIRRPVEQFPTHAVGPARRMKNKNFKLTVTSSHKIMTESELFFL